MSARRRPSDVVAPSAPSAASAPSAPTQSTHWLWWALATPELKASARPALTGALDGPAVDLPPGMSIATPAQDLITGMLDKAVEKTLSAAANKMWRTDNLVPEESAFEIDRGVKEIWDAYTAEPNHLALLKLQYKGLTQILNATNDGVDYTLEWVQAAMGLLIAVLKTNTPFRSWKDTRWPKEVLGDMRKLLVYALDSTAQFKHSGVWLKAHTLVSKCTTRLSDDERRKRMEAYVDAVCASSAALWSQLSTEQMRSFESANLSYFTPEDMSDYNETLIQNFHPGFTSDEWNTLKTSMGTSMPPLKCPEEIIPQDDSSEGTEELSQRWSDSDSEDSKDSEDSEDSEVEGPKRAVNSSFENVLKMELGGMDTVAAREAYPEWDDTWDNFVVTADRKHAFCFVDGAVGQCAAVYDERGDVATYEWKQWL